MSADTPGQRATAKTPARGTGSIRLAVLRLLRALTWRRAAIAAVTVVTVLAILAAVKAAVAYYAYRQTIDSARAVSAFRDRDPATLTEDDIERLNAECRALRTALRRLSWATSLPVVDRFVGVFPYVGPRYESGRAALAMGLPLVDAGVTATDIARDVLAAYDATGAFADTPPAANTWLDVVAQRRSDLESIAEEIELAQKRRVRVDGAFLPGSARGYFADIDRAIADLDVGRIVREDLPAALATLGSDAPARYIILFQNPTELRPTGGFPGTMAYVVIERGQVRFYEIHDIRVVSDDYLAKDLTAYPQPWAIQEFFPSPELIFHDADWWADFPRSAEQLARMWVATGRPELTGVVAVQPEVISALLRFTGPLVVEFEGERRRISPDNVLDEIERERRLRRMGIEQEENHKELLQVIGTHIIDNLKTADRGELRSIADALQAEADVRNLQVWMRDPLLQMWADQRHWTGRIVPDANVPTLAIVLANVVTNKASLRMLPSADVTIGPAEGGRRTVTIELFYTHTGTPEEDPFYAGFQRWWTELYLPPGSEVRAAHPDPMPDPESPNGGSYLIAIFPREVGYLSVTFSMPDTPVLLLRRQPGLNALAVTISITGCAETRQLTLQRDTLIDVAPACR